MRRDRSDFWEGIKAHNATVTCAIFAPHPEAIIKPEVEDDDISSVNVSKHFFIRIYFNLFLIVSEFECGSRSHGGATKKRLWLCIDQCRF